MATTRIIPLHAGKGRTVGKAISDIIRRLEERRNPCAPVGLRTS